MVVMVAPLSNRNLTGSPLIRPWIQKWPSMAIGMRISAPCSTGAPVASARSRCATRPRSSRKVKTTKPPAKMAIHASPRVSFLAAGSRRAISEPSTSITAISR
jgi:hypothetical protein